jgi:hypothetical protein
MPVLKANLPDLFTCSDGSRLRSADGWPRRRAEMMDLVLGIEYGHLPPEPTAVHGELLNAGGMRAPVRAIHNQYRLHIEGGQRPFWFIVDLLVPQAEDQSDRKCPVVICGDACWRTVTEEIVGEVLGRGYGLATFNRTEIVPDLNRPARDVALYQVYPGLDFGALAAWAWGYHRVVDLLVTLPFVDPAALAVVGHSRGGKTVLLAGATDERIALTAPNDSGCGGAGSFLYQGDKCERLADLVRAFPFWLSPRAPGYVDREETLGFDQHFLRALVAPRAQLSTEALGDLWANPSGTRQTFLAAREAYRFLGAEKRLGIWYREGEHRHGIVDWKAFLDFADVQLRGLTNATDFDMNPFPDMQPAFAWTAPG